MTTLEYFATCTSLNERWRGETWRIIERGRERKKNISKKERVWGRQRKRRKKTEGERGKGYKIKSRGNRKGKTKSIRKVNT
jgi:hypothetical protein